MQDFGENIIQKQQVHCISTNADRLHDAASRKIDYIASSTEYNY